MTMAAAVITQIRKIIVTLLLCYCAHCKHRTVYSIYTTIHKPSSHYSLFMLYSLFTIHVVCVLLWCFNLWQLKSSLSYFNIIPYTNLWNSNHNHSWCE